MLLSKQLITQVKHKQEVGTQILRSKQKQVFSTQYLDHALDIEF